MKTRLLFLAPAFLLLVNFNAISQTSYFIQQDFSAGGLPSGWTNTNTKSPAYTWRFNNPGLKAINTTTSGNGFAIFDNDYYASSNSDARLVTPAFDATGKSFVYLSVSQFFQKAGNDTASIYVSGNNGASWTRFNRLNASTLNPFDTTFDISSIAAGKASVKVMFSYSGNGSGYWAIDDVSVYEPYTADAGVISIEAPNSDCQLSSQEPVIVTVKNFGAAAISNFNISYEIGSAIVTEVFTGTIAAHAVSPYTFTAKCDLSGITAETIAAYTDLTGEQNVANDASQKSITNLYTDISSSPYIQSFETSDPKLQFFSQYNPDHLNPWSNNSNFRYSGIFSITYSGDGFSDWLFSHCFSLDSSKTYQLKFYANTWVNSKTFSINFAAGNSPEPGSMTQMLIQKSNVLLNGWTQFTTAIKPSTTGNLYFGWNLSAEMNALPSIDYFTIQEAPQKNIGISSLVSPQDGCMAVGDSVKVGVTNFGQDPADNFNIVCKINSIVKANISFEGILAPGQTKVLTLPISNVFDHAGNYLIEAYTIWADDQDVSDDKYSTTLTNSAGNPYSDNVGTGFEYSEQNPWVFTDGADANEDVSWYVTSYSKHSGYQAAYTYVSGDENDDWLMSSCISCEKNAGYSITFWDKNNNIGKTRYEVWAGRSPEADSMKLFLGSFDDTNHGSTFLSHYIALPSPGNGIFYFGVRLINSGQGEIYLDDIQVSKSAAIDPGIAGFVKLVSDCYADTLLPVTIRIVNYGSGALSDIPVSFNNGYQSFNETVPGTLQPGDTVLYTFSTKLEMTYKSDYQVSAYVNMDGDANYSNNSAQMEVGSSLKDAKQGDLSFSSYEMKYWLFKDYNKDTCTWVNDPDNYSVYYQAIKENANDWLFSNCYYFAKDTKYTLALYSDYNQLPSIFKMYLCTERDTLDIQQQIALTRSNSTEGNQYFGWITVPKSGIYYIAFGLEGKLSSYETVMLNYMNMREIPDHDLAIVDIIKPVSGCGHTSSDSVVVKFANYGKNTETVAQLIVNTGSTDYNSVLSFNLDPFDTIEVKTDIGIDLTGMENFLLEYNLSANMDGNDMNNHYTQMLEGDPNLDINSYTDVFSAYDGKSIAIDANSDNNTFQSSIINDTRGMEYTYNQNTPDDWVISRCFKFEKGKYYKIKFDYTSDNLHTDLSVWAGTSPGPSSMKIKLGETAAIELTPDSSVFITDILSFACDSTGVYYLGWHITGNVETGRFWLSNSVISHAIKRDISLNQILSPTTDCMPASLSDLTIALNNNGFEEISKLPVHYSLDNGETIFTDTIPLVTAYEVSNFTFKNQLKKTSNMNLLVWIDLPGDENLGNDTLRTEVQLNFHDFRNGDYLMGFEENQPLLNYYTSEYFGTSPTYMIFNPYEGERFGGLVTQSGQQASLTTHCFLFTGNDTYTLSFADMSYPMFGVPSLEVRIDNAPDFSGSPQVLYSIDQVDNITYEEHSIDFSVQKTGYYYIQWRILPSSGFSEYYFFDGIRISSKCGASEPNLPADTMFCMGTTGVLQVGTYTSYHWNTGDQTSSIQVTSPGTYKLDVEAANGCQFSDSVKVSFADCTPVKQLIAGNKLVIYPNPATNSITVELETLNPKTTLKIIDITGKVVYTEELKTKTRSIDIGNYARGLYLVRVSCGRNTFSDRFIKN